MIHNISLTTVWVKDIEESKAFYVDLLGFEPRDDVTLGDDFRWCTVRHPSQPELHVHLSTLGLRSRRSSPPRSGGRWTREAPSHSASTSITARDHRRPRIEGCRHHQPTGEAPSNPTSGHRNRWPTSPVTTRPASTR